MYINNCTFVLDISKMLSILPIFKSFFKTVITALAYSLIFILKPLSAETLLFEHFDNNSLVSRGWYDNTSLVLTNSEAVEGNSLEYQFNQGGTLPISGGAIRHKFAESETIFVSYYVKYSSNWEGSNLNVHPHEFQLLTNLESDWAAPATTHLTAYIEQNEGVPMLLIQDTLNVDQAEVGRDLSNITESRGVAGCNGNTDGYIGDCYQWDGIYRNGKSWRAGQIYFTDNTGPKYKNDWHLIEAQFTLNSIENGKGINDGVMRYWYDGELVIDHENVLFRTAEHPNMKFNQLLIAPYIGGSGSPVDQKFWIDELSISTTKIHNVKANPKPPTGLSVE